MIVSRAPSEYEPLPIGVIPAVCVTYFDCGIQIGFQGKHQHKVVILWELDARKTDGSRFLATKSYTASLSEKANLTADLQSWRGRAFTDAELEGFNLDNIVGKPCQLNLVQGTKGNGDNFVGIQTVMLAPRGWKAFAVETAPDYVPEFVKKMIDSQLETPAPDGMDEYKAASGSSSGRPDQFDDDIPF
jgi:hypothetical protein